MYDCLQSCKSTFKIVVIRFPTRGAVGCPGLGPSLSIKLGFKLPHFLYLDIYISHLILHYAFTTFISPQ